MDLIQLIKPRMNSKVKCNIMWPDCSGLQHHFSVSVSLFRCVYSESVYTENEEQNDVEPEDDNATVTYQTPPKQTSSLSLCKRKSPSIL